MADQNKQPVVLAVLDGWGFSKKTIGNPIASANKPIIDMLRQNYPMALLQASGLAVGMTWGESGNSEVGHLNIGAGRIVEQYLSRINRSIKDGSFFNNTALAGAFDHAQKNNSRIHIIGLLTSGTVHASFSHLAALVNMAADKKWGETYLHLFLDGKDSGLQEAPELLERLQNEISSAPGYAKIATVIGRNFAMDRDNNWELTRQAYELLASANGEASDDPLTTIQRYYAEGKNDSTMPPLVATASGFSGLQNNDALIFFNFREDSMRQILKPFVEPDFALFPRADLKNLYIATMTQYLENLASAVAFMPPEIKNGLSEILAANSRQQLHIAETEKYAHVTYFFNGLTTKERNGEIDVFIESVKNPEQNPEMKSLEIAKRVSKEAERGFYDFIVLNFANPDVLAHTGDFEATKKGVEAVDAALGLIINTVLEKNGIMIVTADHGNAESLIYKEGGEPETRHGGAPVPLYLIGRQFQAAKTEEQIALETEEISGILADVAPTVLELMAIPQPEEMTGKSLLPLLVANR